MPTVVLIGFSCAGKSNVAAAARKRWGSDITTLDSDDWIAAQHQDNMIGKHIYGLFLKLGREAALVEIARLEREFLSSQLRSDDAVLIAAGPWLVAPSRNPELAAFRERVDPSCILLEVSPETATKRLEGRRRTQAKKDRVAEHANFRSWDEGVTSARKGFRWIDLPHDTALRNVTRLIQGLQPVYGALALEGNRFPAAHNDSEREPILARIADLLGLPGGRRSARDADL